MAARRGGRERQKPRVKSKVGKAETEVDPLEAVYLSDSDFMAFPMGYTLDGNHYREAQHLRLKVINGE
jgi:hypothetical protein